MNCQVCNCKITCSRKQSKRSVGCSCINANEKCGARCKCCTSKLQCRKGKQENVELQNAQRLPVSAFDRHSEYIVNATEEIKVCSFAYNPVYIFWLHTKPTRESCLAHFMFGFIIRYIRRKKDKLLVKFLAQGKHSLYFAKNMLAAANADDVDINSVSARLV